MFLVWPDITIPGKFTMRSQVIDMPVSNQQPDLEERPDSPPGVHFDAVDEAKTGADPSNQDAFGNEEFAEVKYKVLKWWYVARASLASSGKLLNDLIE